MIIKDAVFVISNTQVDKCPEPKFPEYAFIGRSNVGKSSLINMLTDRKKLAKTSSFPGKTQLINHFIINDNWYLVDLPGYGYARASPVEKKQWTALIDKLPERGCIAGLVLIVDIRRGISEPDQQLIEWATAAGWQVG